MTPHPFDRQHNNDLVRDILERETAVDRDKIVPEATLADDLQTDSLDRVEIAMEIEKEFNIDVSDDELDGWKTVADVQNTVAKILAP